MYLFQPFIYTALFFKVITLGPTLITDLKKTMAVLLENMLDRLDRLEHRVDDALKNGSLGGASLVEQTRQIEDLRQQIDKKLMETMERGNPEAEAKRAMTLPPGVKPIIDMKGQCLPG